MKLVSQDQITFELNLPTMQVGRDPANDIVINDPSVSSLHAYIQKQDGTFLIWDAGSTNGTSVNNIRLTGSYLLNPGDIIVFGNYQVAALDDWTPASQAKFTLQAPQQTPQPVQGVNVAGSYAQASASPQTQYGPQPVFPGASAVYPAAGYGQVYNAPTYSTGTKDKSVALILEILPGLFGFLGIGWLYSGQTGTGLAWLIGYFIFMVVAITIDVLTVGVGCFCTVPLNIACVALSAYNLNKFTSQHPELYKP